ncbi:MAG: hypothetical protein B7Y07_05255 [Halothiobacillus sp. 24-54-40]|jgi:hypothetical protein|nr:hypothetical protein [Halothiobacillaceae bacterium]OYV46497.1 MAG: hypothetical protein B7X12_04900 [Halothiobacillus sp. 20-53-49]OYY40602.1 MAG: hypothetical protein B7Y58_03835 [Halothiobacillus sp. 35-54-62]OYY56101.1 MAG: hypothetical protein B7Y53_02550 [Halothiobacillus sp. 28-55-5]OYZ87186.1 MAG: hypothetical protein B7Y07_05255 [Halothiobacillus sp. 24-54-40]OZA80770.1 MAG: hypothetical protein B7X64_04560 [Halothiobacillus sp. 39-53-45]HQS03545.1 hypothetical protein [Halothioba
MNLKRIITSIMLMFAVWLPLDNALAAAVIEGCPMMSHAFADGLNKMGRAQTSPLHVPCHEMSMMASAPMGADAPPAYHCVNGCEHCSLCLLLGSVALPCTAVLPAVLPVLSQPLSSPSAHIYSDVAACVFRPPIV